VWGGRICALLQSNPAFPASSANLWIVQPGGNAIIPVSIGVGEPNFTGEPGQYRFHVEMAMQVLGNYHILAHDQSVSDTFTLLP
jgi:hypothetical protein